MNELLEKAIKIAVEAHAGQTDKYGMPYILHVLSVMEKCKSLDEKIVGVLHDVVEDCDGWDFDRLESEGFPEHIVDAIRLLTKPEGADYLEYVYKAKNNSLARAVKLCDLEHNMTLIRMDKVREKDIERLNRYLKAYRVLKS